MVCGLLRRFTPRNDKERTVIARVDFAIRGNLDMGHWDGQTKLVIARL